MAMYQVGDRVRIKKKEGEECSYPFCFTDDMSDMFSGKIVTIQWVFRKEADYCRERPMYNGDSNGYRIKEDGGKFSWHSSMFEPVLEEPKNLTKEGYIREGTVINLGPYKGVIKGVCDGFFLDMSTDTQGHDAICKEIEKIVPDYREISKKYFVGSYETAYCSFPICNTIASLYMYCSVLNDKITEALCLGKQIITPEKLNENEIKFQRKKPSFTRGSVPKGSPICGRKHKTAIVVGHLSNQEISC